MSAATTTYLLEKTPTLNQFKKIVGADTFRFMEKENHCVVMYMDCDLMIVKGELKALQNIAIVLEKKKPLKVDLRREFDAYYLEVSMLHPDPMELKIISSEDTKFFSKNSDNWIKDIVFKFIRDHNCKYEYVDEDTLYVSGCMDDLVVIRQKIDALHNAATTEFQNRIADVEQVKEGFFSNLSSVPIFRSLRKKTYKKL
jgi:hypothetical protein